MSHEMLSVPVDKTEQEDLLLFIDKLQTDWGWSKAKVCRYLLIHGMKSVRKKSRAFKPKEFA